MRRKRGTRGFMDGPLRTIIVNRREYEINVDSDGEFRAHVAGDYIKADTMNEVIAQIRKKAKKLEVKIAVPVTVVGHRRTAGSKWTVKYIGDVHHGTIVEYDNDNSAYKIRFDDGGIETLDKWGNADSDFQINRPMTVDEIKEWQRLRTEREKASERFYKYAKRFEFKNVHDVVKRAYDDAIDTPNEDGADATGDPRLDG